MIFKSLFMATPGNGGGGGVAISAESAPVVFFFSYSEYQSLEESLRISETCLYFSLEQRYFDNNLWVVQRIALWICRSAQYRIWIHPTTKSEEIRKLFQTSQVYNAIFPYRIMKTTQYKYSLIESFLEILDLLPAKFLELCVGVPHVHGRLVAGLLALIDVLSPL